MKPHFFNACDVYEGLKDGVVVTGHPTITVSSTIYEHLKSKALEAGLKEGDFFTVTVQEQSNGI